MFEGIFFDTDSLIETQGQHGGHIFPGASREFPKIWIQDPWEVDIWRIIYAQYYSGLSTQYAQFPFVLIHTWNAYVQLALGQFDQLEGLKKWIWFWYVANVEPRK